MAESPKPIGLEDDRAQFDSEAALAAFRAGDRHLNFKKVPSKEEDLKINKAIGSVASVHEDQGGDGWVIGVRDGLEDTLLGAIMSETMASGVGEWYIDILGLDPYFLQRLRLWLVQNFINNLKPARPLEEILAASRAANCLELDIKQPIIGKDPGTKFPIEKKPLE